MLYCRCTQDTIKCRASALGALYITHNRQKETKRNIHKTGRFAVKIFILSQRNDEYELDKNSKNIKKRKWEITAVKMTALTSGQNFLHSTWNVFLKC